MGKNFIARYQRKRAEKRIAGYEAIHGWLSTNEAIGLFQLANRLPSSALVVEIGSWQGKSTTCLARGLKSGKLFAIDPFNADAGNDPVTQEDYNRQKSSEPLLQTFRNNMFNLGLLNKIEILQGYSKQFDSSFSKIDLLFIDGDHSIDGCRSDFELYAPKISVGGYIVLHDYYPERADLGPTFVVEKLIKPNDMFSFIERIDSLWIGRRK